MGRGGRVGPRAPRAPYRDGLDESHNLTTTDPADGRALWLRHTSLHGKPSVWVTWFDPEPHAQARGAR